MLPIFQTPRLLIRPLALSDTLFIIRLLNSPGWLQYIGDRNVHTEADALAYLENGPLKSYQENGFGLWMVELKEGSTPIGLCGLLKRDYLPHPDIGFAFLPEFEGQGYAFEAAEATLEYAKEKLNLSTVLATTLEGNTRSINLLERIGMKLSVPLVLANDQIELMLYST